MAFLTHHALHTLILGVIKPRFENVNNRVRNIYTHREPIGKIIIAIFQVFAEFGGRNWEVQFRIMNIGYFCVNE